MSYTPRDILAYVYEKHLEDEFLLALASHVENFSIGEITDKRIEKRGEDYFLVSKAYALDIKLTDDDKTMYDFITNNIKNYISDMP